MNHTPFSLEIHVQHVIERIAADRALSAPFNSDAPGLGGHLRQRVGAVLITIGERIGGPAVRPPRPVTPQPSHTPLLSF